MCELTSYHKNRATIRLFRTVNTYLTEASTRSISEHNYFGSQPKKSSCHFVKLVLIHKIILRKIFLLFFLAFVSFSDFGSRARSFWNMFDQFYNFIDVCRMQLKYAIFIYFYKLLWTVTFVFFKWFIINHFFRRALCLHRIGSNLIIITLEHILCARTKPFFLFF